ncbi:hypothetical protein Bhyg_13915 [Pseudolycoriella hygida]|uniref:Uncharacterized protein n=1 Tax=Pseudolycoriella hygida TaxID=35572 RepID=A0A9Q0MNQ5_9DIPT|nr:hypothetical protein Bhyg_13915 [Pseudolycoriella hygida]
MSWHRLDESFHKRMSLRLNKTPFPGRASLGNLNQAPLTPDWKRPVNNLSFLFQSVYRQGEDKQPRTEKATKNAKNGLYICIDEKRSTEKMDDNARDTPVDAAEIKHIRFLNEVGGNRICRLSYEEDCKRIQGATVVMIHELILEDTQSLGVKSVKVSRVKSGKIPFAYGIQIVWSTSDLESSTVKIVCYDSCRSSRLMG